MANFTDKITELWSSWFDGLSGREKRLLSILLAGACLVLILASIYLASSKIHTKRTLLKKNQDQLAEIKGLEGEYLKAKEKNEALMRKLRQNNVSLFTFIPSIGSRLGLTIKDLNEQKRPLGKSGVMEVSVKLNLTKLSIDKLTALIEAIETDEEHLGQVKVTRLKISKNFVEPDLLDLQMTVSTWKSA